MAYINGYAGGYGGQFIEGFAAVGAVTEGHDE